MRLADSQRGIAGECALPTGNTWFMAVCGIIISFRTVKTWFTEAQSIAFLSAWSNFHLISILCFHPKTQRHREPSINNNIQTSYQISNKN